jgi:hypothetical protein
MIDPRNLARALGGEVHGEEILAPGPGHSADDRSLSVKLDANAPGGFVVNPQVKGSAFAHGIPHCGVHSFSISISKINCFRMTND